MIDVTPGKTSDKMYPEKISFSPKAIGMFRLVWFFGSAENTATRVNGEILSLNANGDVEINCGVPKRPGHETKMDELFVYGSDLTERGYGAVKGNGFYRFLCPENTENRLFLRVETLDGREIEVDNVSIEWRDL